MKYWFLMNDIVFHQRGWRIWVLADENRNIGDQTEGYARILAKKKLDTEARIHSTAGRSAYN